MVARNDECQLTSVLLASEKDLPDRLLPTIIEQGPKALFMYDKDGQMPIHIAVKSCPPKKIEILLNACPESIFEKTKEGDTPLEWAKYNDRNDKIITLLENFEKEQKHQKKSGKRGGGADVTATKSPAKKRKTR